MKSTGFFIFLSCAVAVSLLSGCAASVKSGSTEALTIEQSAKKNLVVNIQGTARSSRTMTGFA
ncbi:MULTISPECIES: hypothetical protein [unclassified Pseudomonas]|uniref:hypothetical protein n=1 Tax=Pseudomonas TaxID=286 RepID=UPI0021142CA7|nr:MULTISPECIES: hypothetical protein [unclassified Pseudomonas]